MIRVVTAHTAELEPAVLLAARSMLEDVFHGELDDQDWDHGLGGLHVLAWDGPELIGHASVVQRRLMHGGRALRAGYVEGVGVRADRQRAGVGSALMTPLEGVIRRSYDLGGLGSTDEGAPLYRSHGWQLWRGPCWALTPGGRVRTQDEEGWIYVLPGDVPLDLDGDLTCDWRDGDVW